MSPSLSTRMHSMGGSATGRAAHARPASDAQDWIDLSVGCPDWAPPPACLEAASAAASGPTLGYGRPGGCPDLRARLAEESAWHSPSSKVESIVTSGGKEALFLALGAALSPGDTVLVCAPYWPSFLEQIRAWGAIPHIVPSDNEGLPQLIRLAAEAEQAQAIIVNTPCNPSGRLWPTESIQRLAYLARRHDLWVLVDGVYGALCHQRDVTGAAVELPENLSDRTVVIDSGSKAFALAGLRVGWAVGTAHWIQGMRHLQDATSTHPSLPGQAALSAALDAPAEWALAVRERLRLRAQALWLAVQGHPQLSMRLPEAGLFGWLKVSCNTDDVHLAKSLAATHSLSVVPGSVFGAPGRVRLALTAGTSVLTEAAARINRAAAHSTAIRSPHRRADLE